MFAIQTEVAGLREIQLKQPGFLACVAASQCDLIIALTAQHRQTYKARGQYHDLHLQKSWNGPAQSAGPANRRASGNGGKGTLLQCATACRSVKTICSVCQLCDARIFKARLAQAWSFPATQFALTQKAHNSEGTKGSELFHEILSCAVRVPSFTQFLHALLAAEETPIGEERRIAAEIRSSIGRCDCPSDTPMNARRAIAARRRFKGYRYKRK